MKLNHFFHLLGLGFAISLAPGLINLAHAEPTQNLDIVLLMDSSGSMKLADPKQLRKPAAKLLLSLLGENDRAGVVSFSDDGYPVAYLTPVKGDQNRQKLFDAVDKISTRGVFTNITGAIDAAMNVLNRNKLPDRRQSIVLMSDGKIDMGGSIQSSEMTRQLLEQQLPALHQQGIQIQSIAFTPNSDQTLLKTLAEKTGGKFYLANSDKQLHSVYAAIFENTKVPNQVPFKGDSFVLDDAVTETTVIGSKDEAGTSLSLVSPGGTSYSKSNAPSFINWFESSQFDLITLQHPSAGKWQLLSSAGNNKAYVITDLGLSSSTEPSAPAVGEGVMIKAWLTEKTEKLSKPEIMADLSVTVEVKTPEGELHHLDMEPYSNYEEGPQNAGVFASNIAFPSAGLFKLNIIVKGKTFSRERQVDLNVGAVVATAQPSLQAAMDAVINGDLAKETQATGATTGHSDPVANAHAEKATDTAVAPSDPSTEPVSATETSTSSADITPKIQLPPVDGQAEDATPATAEHKKAKDEQDPKASAHDKTQEKKDKANHPAKEDGGSPLKMAIFAFVGINIVLALIGGIAFVVVRRKKAKAQQATDAGEPTEAGAAKVKEGKGKEGKDRKDNKERKEPKISKAA